MRELSLHILDLVNNSLTAGADRIKVGIEASSKRDRLCISITDNGRGIPPEILATVTDPFVTTRKTRPVGLGLSLFKEHCELTGGSLQIASEPGKGTCLTGQLAISSIDRLPLGELDETFAVLIASCPHLDLVLEMIADDRSFCLDLTQIRDRLAEVQLNEPAVLEWLRSLIKEQQEHIFGGVLNEIFSRT